MSLASLHLSVELCQEEPSIPSLDSGSQADRAFMDYQLEEWELEYQFCHAATFVLYPICSRCTEQWFTLATMALTPASKQADIFICCIANPNVYKCQIKALHSIQMNYKSFWNQVLLWVVYEIGPSSLCESWLTKINANMIKNIWLWGVSPVFHWPCVMDELPLWLLLQFSYKLLR